MSEPQPIPPSQYLVLDDRIIDEVIAAELTLGEITKHPQNGATPYDWGTIFPSAPIFFNDEVRIYYGAGDGYFFNWRKGYLALATLRPDGWAGYEPITTDMPAVITTQPLTFDGTSVGITADVSDGGSVRVAILDKAGNQLASSQLVRSTVTDCRVKWELSQNLTNLRGKEIRLRFQLHNAKLYAFQTGTESG